MCDLIKRKDVLNIIHDYFGTVIDERTDKYKEGSEIPIGVIDDILSHNKAICTKIKELPAVDANPVVHGEWISQDMTYTKFMCSQCNSKNHAGHEKFCPNCGARMDGE